MDNGKCFVIQPFDNGGIFDKRYDNIFSPAIMDAGLIPLRIDRLHHSEDLILDIKINIKSATICLADITIDNPNVWFELGYAYASNKKVVLICSSERQGNKFPFDIQDKKIIIYKHNNDTYEENLKLKITNTLLAYLKNIKNIQLKHRKNILYTSSKYIATSVVSIIVTFLLLGQHNADNVGDLIPDGNPQFNTASPVVSAFPEKVNAQKIDTIFDRYFKFGTNSELMFKNWPNFNPNDLMRANMTAFPVMTFCRYKIADLLTSRFLPPDFIPNDKSYSDDCLGYFYFDNQGLCRVTFKFSNFTKEEIRERVFSHCVYLFNASVSLLNRSRSFTVSGNRILLSGVHSSDSTEINIENTRMSGSASGIQ